MTAILRPVAALLAMLLLVLPLGAAPLDNEVRRITESGRSGQALWGVYAVELKSGKELVTVNHGKLFVPASNRKLVTAALASRQFGKDEQIETRITAGSVLADGTARDVVLHAAGDPTWTPEFLGGRPGRHALRELARAMQQSGVRRIDGDLIINTHRFQEPEPIPPGWAWDELRMNYAPRPSALALDKNLAAVAVAPGRAGSPPDVTIRSLVAPFEIHNNAETGRAGSADTLVMTPSLGGDFVEVQGSIPADAQGAARAIPISNPVRIAGHGFGEVLRESGIDFRGKVVFEGTAGRSGTTIAIFAGAPVSGVLKKCMEDSDNYYAESLYLLAGAKAYSRGGYRASRELEGAYWKKIGVDPSEVLSSDGSGLSRENYISPRALVELLRERRDSDWFFASLPVSGKTGTLRYRLSKDGMAGRVFAKTGTLDGVSGLSGYVRTASGKEIAFSILANNYTCSAGTIRASIDSIVTLLARQ